LNGETGVDLNQAITFTFSEAMDTSTFITANIDVSGKDNGIPGIDPEPISDPFNITYTSTTLTLSPKVPWGNNYKVYVVISKNVRSIKGNSLEKDITYSYTTKLL
jgi:hypothetical protein